MSKYHQTGAAQAVAIVVLVVALLGALGWIFYQNMTKENAKVESTDTSKLDDSKKVETAPESEVKAEVAPKYIDFRKNKKDITGVELTSKADVGKLTGTSSELKTYFESIAGVQEQDPFDDGKMYTPTYTVDQVYGKYAVGSGPSYYRAWGPKDGTGKIVEVAGTQNTSFVCDDLETAKFPSQLTNGKCFPKNGSGPVQAYQD